MTKEDPDWSEAERNALRRGLLRGGWATPRSRSGVGGILARLGRAVAFRDYETIRALVQEGAMGALPPAGQLRLALAYAATGAEDAGNVASLLAPDQTDRDRVAAALLLGRPARTLQPGSTEILFGQAIPIVEAVLDGRHRGYFIVDTGAPHSVLSRAWCRRRGIELPDGVRHSVDDGAGREMPATAFRVGRLEAGGVSADVPVVAFDFPSGLDVAGIVSPLDAFAGAAVTLDRQHERLVIDEDDVGGEVTALFWEGGVPLVPARVAEVDALLLLDSGAGGEVLCEDFALGFGTSGLDELETLTAAGPFPIRAGLRLPLQVGTTEPTWTSFAVKACISTGTDTSLVRRDGLLGGGWMASRRIRVSRDRRRLSIGF